MSEPPPKSGRSQVEVKPKAEATGQGRRSSPDAAFEMWLNRGLHAIYDQVAQEPVPQHLLDLIQRDAEATTKK